MNKLRLFGKEMDGPFSNLAPTGCTQWFYGEVEGQIQSFNFNGGQHLANQNQNICIRYISY
jgi:hypothetical protein